MMVDDCQTVMTAMFVVKGSRLALAPRIPVPLESAAKFESAPPLRENLQPKM
jgi:hypothetical protein